MQIPFGKYRGEELTDIPETYLLWVLDNIEDLRPSLRRGIEDALGIASEPPRPKAPPPPPPPVTQPTGGAAGGVTLDQVIRAWHRLMAKKYHPDVGGSHEAMVVVNEGAELLKKLANNNK